jgi:hypothetical protein
LNIKSRPLTLSWVISQADNRRWIWWRFWATRPAGPQHLERSRRSLITKFSLVQNDQRELSLEASVGRTNGTSLRTSNGYSVNGAYPSMLGVWCENQTGSEGYWHAPGNGANRSFAAWILCEAIR